jgi:hypothetical protein
MLKKGINYKLISQYNCSEGRFVVINIEIDGIGMTIANIYAPNDIRERIAYFANVTELINMHALYQNVMIGGDFNSVVNREDRQTSNLDGTSTHLNSFINNLHLNDAWRDKNEGNIEYTYIDPSRNMRNSRIDLWLISDSIANIVKSCNIKQSPSPDHKAVVMEISMNNKNRGKGYWKLNSSLIEDPSYVEVITELITKTIDEYDHFLSKSELWEYLKQLIKEHSIKFSIAKSIAKKNEILTLEERIDKIDTALKTNINPTLQNDRKTLKLQLDKLYTEKSKGYHIRARAKWLEEGEKSTAYFCGLEKSRQSNNCIYGIRNKYGQLNTSDEEILNVAHDYYETLYSTKQTDAKSADEYIQRLTPEQILTDIEKDSCEGEITMDECKMAVSNLKDNKSPGLDGITSEFYKMFWPIIGTLIVDVFNESLNSGILPPSERIAVISLIFKKGKSDDLNNYRPISLTNLDYKILAHVLANRLQSVISSIVHTDQTAYIKGRYMGQNVILLADVFEMYRKLDKTGIVLALDFQKAFDSLEWNYLDSVLKFFNFGDMFINWVKLLYTKPVAHVKNNGYISEAVNISRGIRQGCPVSALLFILAVETLGIKIRSSPHLNGLSIGNENKTVKISQYADDGILYLNNKDEMRTALNILSEFGKVAGTILNTSKCEAMCLGKINNNYYSEKPFGFKWKYNIKCLGIYIGHNTIENHNNNFTQKVENIKSSLQKWSKRDLTLFGKVHVIKTLALSQIILPATILHVPPDVISQLNHIFFKFIWGKVDRLKRNNMIKDTCNGGLGMVDVISMFDSLKASWMIRILKGNPVDENWLQIPLAEFGKLGGISIVK